VSPLTYDVAALPLSIMHVCGDALTRAVMTAVSSCGESERLDVRHLDTAASMYPQ